MRPLSRQELVSAFLEGRVSRRTLIRRLIAGGVSTGAAISYAQMLDPQRAGAAVAVAGANDHYPLVDMKITSTVAGDGAQPGAARGRGHLQRGAATTLLPRLPQDRAAEAFRSAADYSTSFIAAAGTRPAGVPIDVGALGSRASVRFYVHLQGTDAERFPALATAGKTLR